MEIFVAKNSGFCFGVKNAVDKAVEQSGNGRKIYTYGPIIHNDAVVQDLKERGIEAIDDLSGVNKDDIVVIRSHGISKNEYNNLVAKEVKIIDATCPNVDHIHKIVEDKFYNGYKIIIIGDENHPEVKGINGWCSYSAEIVNNEEDADKVAENLVKICVVSQTTFNQIKWHEIVLKLIDKAEEILIYNTICNATQLRQNEALELSKKMDLMIIIGGKHSSNTAKLFEICSENCKSILVEDEKDIDLSMTNGMEKIGITAGTSTPEYIINRVVDKIKGTSGDTVGTIEGVTSEAEVNDDNYKTSENAVVSEVPEVKEDIDTNREETMEDIYSFYDDIYPGNIIEGKILLVNDKELFVDIGYKADGILPLEEISYETVNLKEKFKPGDKITVEVLKTNDGEGNVVLSRKAVEKEEYFNTIRKYKDEGTPIEVLIAEANKGGLSCQFGEISAFMPLSLSGLRKGENSDSLVGKKFKVKINDIKERRDGIELIVSRRDIVNEERKAKISDFIEKAQCGDNYKGRVKSMINAGAFISVDDVDVFIPVSEIAWKRISGPQEILKENQMVDVLIIKIDPENKKITGSIKRTGPEPFEKFVLANNEGDIIEGKVVRFADFGAFIEIDDGVDGLLHISNISDNHINKPQDLLKLGQVLKLKVIKIDKETKRISLSLKDAE